MTGAPASPFYAPPRWEGAQIGVGGLIGYLLLAYFLGEGRGTVAGGFVTSFAVALRICWPLRKQIWFWLAILVLAALHVLAVVLFKWSAAADWKGPTFMPFMAADIVLILAVIYFIYRSIYGTPAQLVTEPEPRYAGDGD
jgi:hypothetical protein